MRQTNQGKERAPTATVWTLALAGAREDDDARLWAPPPLESDSRIGRLIRQAWGRKLLFVTMFAAVFAPAAAFVASWKTTYEASALLSFQAPHVEQSAGGPPPAVDLAVETARIHSREALRQVAERLGPADQADAVAGRLAKEIRIAAAGANSIVLEYADANAERAALVVNTLAATYLAQRAEAYPGGQPDGSPEVSLASPATPPASPKNRHPVTFLTLSFLAAAAGAFAAVGGYEELRRPVMRVADIANATGAPVLRMTEEAKSHVS